LEEETEHVAQLIGLPGEESLNLILIGGLFVPYFSMDLTGSIETESQGANRKFKRLLPMSNQAKEGNSEPLSRVHPRYGIEVAARKRERVLCSIILLLLCLGSYRRRKEDNK